MHKSSIQNGLFLGAAMAISSYVLYLADPGMFFKSKTSVLFLIFIILMVKSGLDARKNNGGFISFGSAFKNMFITGAIGTLICTVFEFLQFNFIAPELIDMQKEMQMEAAERLSEMFSGMSDEVEDAVEESLEKIENDNPASIGNTIKNFVVRLVTPVALFGALIALFIKRDGRQPMDNLDDKNESKYVVNK